jgi:hypothetical protein
MPQVATAPRTFRIVLGIVIYLNQARCCEAEAPRFMRLVLGVTLADADHYAQWSRFSEQIY